MRLAFISLVPKHQVALPAIERPRKRSEDPLLMSLYGKKQTKHRVAIDLLVK